MTRAWIGTALLAGSWLLGRGYFSPARPIVWSVVILCRSHSVGPGSDSLAEQPAAVARHAPWSPGDLAVAVSLSGGCGVDQRGLLLQLVPVPRRWPRTLAGAPWSPGRSCFGSRYPCCLRNPHRPISRIAVATGRSRRLRLASHGRRHGGGRRCNRRQEHAGEGIRCRNLGIARRSSDGLFRRRQFGVADLGPSAGADRATDRCWWARAVVRWLLATAIWIPLRSAVLLALILTAIVASRSIRVSERLRSAGEFVVARGARLVLGAGDVEPVAGLTNQLQHQEGDRSAAFSELKRRDTVPCTLSFSASESPSLSSFSVGIPSANGRPAESSCRAAFDLGANDGAVRNGDLRRGRFVQLCCGLCLLPAILRNVPALGDGADQRCDITGLRCVDHQDADCPVLDRGGRRDRSIC